MNKWMEPTVLCCCGIAQDDEELRTVLVSVNGEFKMNIGCTPSVPNYKPKNFEESKHF
jgi:hypothetical protein